VPDPHQTGLRWDDYEFSAPAAPFPVDAVRPPPSYPDPVYLRIPGRGTALVSDPIDRALPGPGLVSELAREPYHLAESLRAAAPYVLRACNHGRLVFNGEVVGMRGDPLPPVSGRVTPIRLHTTRFFDSQCSNDLCALRITHRDSGEECDPRPNLLATPGGQLRTLAESPLANAIGVSTLAVTADGWSVLVRQSRLNVASPMLLAPSGSGSLDVRDLGRRRTAILQDILRRAMHRELREETAIRPDEIKGTTVAGFARWLDRGAKPEFFGLTRLSVTAADLAGRRALAPGERPYSEGTLTARIDLDALGRELDSGADLLTAPSLPGRIREDGSLPLLLALRAAARTGLRSDPRAAAAPVRPPHPRRDPRPPAPPYRQDQEHDQGDRHAP
jgi:8-oxo-dGTP pyrophosphatase MutT (NUDIX family)